MAAVQTTTIETVSVVRPLKVISLICLGIAIGLSIVALSTTCAPPLHNRQMQHHYKALLCPDIAILPRVTAAVAALMIIALIFTAVTFLLNICGLSRRDVRRKYIFYKFATYIAIFAVILELIALIVFPACFYTKMKDYGSRRDWEVDWSYGLAWGATLFTFGAALLLICDKEHEEVYYKEKTIYNPPPEFS